MKRVREETDRFHMANCLMLISKVGEINNIKGGGFKCKTCNREFSSFQALGGHRASHKKPKMMMKMMMNSNNDNNKVKMHECHICGLEFSIGQALGGHMRKHRDRTTMTNDGSVTPNNNADSKRNIDLHLDLNLTPRENDDLNLHLHPPLVYCFI